MADAMSGWHDAQDYQAYVGPALVQVLQEWVVTAGGWRLLEYLRLRRPPTPVMPASTTTQTDGFLMTPERVHAGATSSVVLSSDLGGSSSAVGSVDPSLTLHFTSGSGFSRSAAGSAAP
nr:uncharacterized protein LOC109157428 [Ipomoea trifida]